MKYTVFIILLIVLCLFSGCIRSSQEDGLYFVAQAVDGDTVRLSNGARLRYIGIDTPETREKISGQWIWNPQAYGVEARDFNKNMVEGKKVRLEFDIEKKDKYGRWLAYVFVEDVFVNEMLLEKGLARVFTHRPNVKYLNRYIKAENRAKKENLGIWSPE